MQFVGEALDRVLRLAQVLDFFALRREEIVQQVGEQRGPVRRRQRRRDAPVQRGKQADETPQRTERDRIRPFGVACRQARAGASMSVGSA
jgi:hypothetical protein